MQTLTRRAALALPLAMTVRPTAGVFAQAAAWKPQGTVRIVVPQAPGGTTDVMARFLAAHLQTRWSQSVVVENKPGAGGAIGTMDVVRSTPDGHSILIGNVGPQSIAYTLQREIPYGPDDLIPVSNMIHGPNALVINPAIPATTVPEFVAYLRANPGKANFGTPGIGQSPHLAGVWFSQLTGTQSTPVHYRGAGPAATDLIGGTIQFMFDALVNATEPAKAGLVRMLAVTGVDRYPNLPDIPAIRETMPELASFASTSWVGVFLAKGTPAPIVEALNGEIKALLEQAGQRERFIGMGGLPGYSSAGDYAAFVRAETQKWAAVIKRAGLSVTAN